MDIVFTAEQVANYKIRKEFINKCHYCGSIKYFNGGNPAYE